MLAAAKEIHNTLDAWLSYLKLAMEQADKLLHCTNDELSDILDHRHRILYKTDECRTRFMNLWDEWCRAKNTDAADTAVIVEKRKLVTELANKMHFQTERVLLEMNRRLSTLKIELNAHNKTQSAIRSYSSFSTK